MTGKGLEGRDGDWPEKGLERRNDEWTEKGRMMGDWEGFGRAGW